MTDYHHHPSKRATCKRCKRHWLEAGPISWGGNCADCGDQAMLENGHDLRAHHGPYFHHWRTRLLAAFGVRE